MMETSMTSLPSPEECRCLIIKVFVQNLITRFSQFLVLYIVYLNGPVRRSTRRRRRLPEIPKDKRRKHRSYQNPNAQKFDMIKCQQGVKGRNGNAIICQPRTPNQQNVKPVEITKSGGRCLDESL